MIGGGWGIPLMGVPPPVFQSNSVHSSATDFLRRGILWAYDTTNPDISPSTPVYRAISEINSLPGADGNLDTVCTLSGDLHLLSGSACIDVGTPAGAPFLDMDGDVRDAMPDIGPDEYVP
jgi:hypothetical protein